MPIADAISITFIQPMIVTVISAVWLGEVIRWRRVSSILIGFAGAMLVIRPHFLSVGWAALLPFGAAIAFALYIILTKRLASDIHPVQMQFNVGAVSVVTVCICWLLIPDFGGGIFDFQFLNSSQMGWSLLLGFIATSGHLVIVYAMQKAPASLLAPIQYVEIIGATLIGFVVFHDVPTLSTCIGISMIIGAGLFLFYREHQAAHELN